MMYRNVFYRNNGCFGFNYFPYWNFLVIGAIIVSIVAIFIWTKKHKNNNDYFIYLLREKFAKGEISEDEYLSKKEILSKK